MYLKEDFPPSVLQKRKELQEELERERQAGKRVVLRYDKIVELKKREPQNYTHTERNKRPMSISPEDVGKVNTKTMNHEGTKPAFKKNKPQHITSFLRPSQQNLNTQTSPNEKITRKN